MQLTKTIASVIFSAAILLACNSNNSTKGSIAGATDNSSASTSSGDDMYYELTTTSAGKGMSINGVTKMYVSSKGDMRTENMINSFKGNKSSAPIIVIAHSNKPDESIIIDDSAKTYSINHINLDDLDTTEKTESTVTKVGEEKILGFNCVHAKIISKKSIGSFYSIVDTVDVWRSNDVPMQSAVKDLMNQFESRTGNYMYSKEVTDQLKQMGCVGFMVKMQMGSKDVSIVMQLTKVEHRDLPASMFEIPAGYKEDKSGM